MTMIHERIIETANRVGRKHALVTTERGAITYDELTGAARAFAKRLPHAMRIGICIKDAIDFAVVYLGTLMRDGQIVVISASATNKEIMAILRNTDCTALITDRMDLKDPLGQVCIYSPRAADRLDRGTHLYPPGESVIMIPTSGSTSACKIVMMSHGALLWNADAHNAHLRIQPDETALIILPLTSSFAHTTQFLSQLINAGTEGFEIGEIWVKSPSPFQGYYDSKLKTSSGFRRGEWLRTGDLGYMDARNRLHVMGRLKNIILVGGFNVFPEEVEDVLCGFPGVEV